MLWLLKLMRPFLSMAPLLATLLLVWATPAGATPQFARRYQVDCAQCHSAPPRLNQRGLEFLARGYRWPGSLDQRGTRTPPLAVWSTIDLDRRTGASVRGFPSRLEIISAGPIGATPLSYFVEWRAISQQVGAGGRLLNRSGRFEDLFVNIPIQAFTITGGQFRALDQVDVSLRLSLSEPLAFATSVPGTQASSARLTGLRGFSPAGRQPGVRVSYQPGRAGRAADGWYVGATLPVTGELTIPFADASSFELEGRPKGAFLETYYRRGLHSLGGHAFAGGDRWLMSVVGTRPLRPGTLLFGAAGAAHAAGVTDGRFSVGGEQILTPWAAAGLRLDHRSARQRPPSYHIYLDGLLPFGPPRARQALRLQIEQQLQRGDHRTTIALSHLF
jgi:hypothetical protein